MLKIISKVTVQAIDYLFKEGISGNTVALAFLRLTAIFWRGPIGLFEFRRGNISACLNHLEHTHFHVGATSLCLDRAREASRVLTNGYSVNQSSNALHPFNYKVLFACHSSGYFLRNGYAVRTAQIANALNHTGIQVFACTRLGYPWDLFGSDIDERPESTIHDGLEYQHFFDVKKRIYGPDSKYINAYTEKLFIEALKKNVSVIHAYSSYSNGLAANAAASRLNILSVYEMRGLWHLSRAVKEPSYESSEHFTYCEQMELAAANGADRVVTLNMSMKNWCIDRGVNPNKISIVPNGIVPNGEFDRSVKSPVEDKHFQLGFIGSITEYEGLEDLIHAISLLTKLGHNIHCKIAGTGEFLHPLRRLCKTLKLTDNVEFLGHIEGQKILGFYRSLDLAVVVRKNSTMTRLIPPLKLAESLSLGVPTLITDLPALREILGERASLFIACPDNPSSICNQIIEIMGKPDESEALSGLLKNRIDREYNWQTNSSNYLKIYAHNLCTT